MDERALLTRIAAKDQEAFEILYRRYERPLYQYLFTLIRQQTWVEEVVSDIMLEVWKSAATFQGTAKVSTWLFGIARHKALSLLRRHSPLQHAVSAEEDRLAQRAALDGDPWQAIQAKERAEQLWQALQTLSPPQREVIECVLMHDLSYMEIAELMGCPVNIVKTRVFYAKQQLKHILREERIGQNSLHHLVHPSIC